MFMCEGLIGESVVAVCELDELSCECGGRCHWGLCVVWGSKSDRFHDDIFQFFFTNLWYILQVLLNRWVFFLKS